MEPVIHDIDPATGESRGIYAIDPDGNLITLGRTQSLKAGFRYATRSDIAPKKAVQMAAPPVPTEMPKLAESKFLGRKSLSTDESNALPKEGPRTERKE